MALLSSASLVPPPQIIGTNSRPVPTASAPIAQRYHQVSFAFTSGLSSFLPFQAIPRLQPRSALPPSPVPESPPSLLFVVPAAFGVPPPELVPLTFAPLLPLVPLVFAPPVLEPLPAAEPFLPAELVVAPVALPP